MHSFWNIYKSLENRIRFHELNQNMSVYKHLFMIIICLYLRTLIDVCNMHVIVSRPRAYYGTHVFWYGRCVLHFFTRREIACFLDLQTLINQSFF